MFFKASFANRYGHNNQIFYPIFASIEANHLKKNKKYKGAAKETVLKDPVAIYAKGKELVFFSSFDEMNRNDRKEMGELTAKERFQHITFLLKSLYADKLKSKTKTKELIFR